MYLTVDGTPYLYIPSMRFKTSTANVFISVHEEMLNEIGQIKEAIRKTNETATLMEENRKLKEENVSDTMFYQRQLYEGVRFSGFYLFGEKITHPNVGITVHVP